MLDLKIGCDPELVLFDKEKGRIVPAVGLVEGTKEDPYMLPNGGMLQLDGTALEFGTPPVSPEGDNFGNALKETLGYVREYMHKRHGDRYSLKCGAIASFDSRDIDLNSPALEVGCSPQYRFVDGKLVELPVAAKLDPRRVPLGGHIHLGFAEKMSHEVAVASALTAVRSDYNPINYSRRYTEEDKVRRGCMRFGPYLALRIKEYGMELRDPSSSWLADPSAARRFSSAFTSMVSSIQGKGFRNVSYFGAMPSFDQHGLADLAY